jgi:hypothetical protein
VLGIRCWGLGAPKKLIPKKNWGQSNFNSSAMIEILDYTRGIDLKKYYFL